MKALFLIDDIIGSPCKVGLLRAITSRKGFRATGREIARLAGFSVPATHESLKDLYAHNILNLEVMGRQHIYSLNEDSRIVQKIIRPMFEAESESRDDIGSFIMKILKHQGIQRVIVSVLLYGSVQKGDMVSGSDVDIAIVVGKQADVERVSDVFFSEIVPQFKSYFGAQLDCYIKSADEFRERLKKNQPPVSTLIRAYSVLYGKEPLEV